MDRLTERDEFGNADIIGVDSQDLTEALDFDQLNLVTDALNRLTAYEDTGLEPEEVNALKRAKHWREVEPITHFEGVPIEHAIELVQAEKDGRLVVLPCKIGDTVYVIPSKANRGLNILHGHPENNRVYEQPVREIRFYKGCVFLLMTCDGTQSVHSEFFGKTWFLTREAAEAALEGENNEN